MYYTYINHSISTGKYYIGSTENIKRRLLQHNQAKSKSTRYGRTWELMYKKGI